MRKIICAINITLDGFCDHTAGIVDDDLHEYYTEFMGKMGISVMGRKTYELMENYWPEVAKNKTGTDSEIRFAENFDEIQKIMISRSRKSVTWNNSSIISENVIEEISKLKEGSGKQISVGSPSIISLLTRNNLVDEFMLLIHPIILGTGLKLFKEIAQRVDLELLATKAFNSGVIVTHYRVKP